MKFVIEAQNPEVEDGGLPNMYKFRYIITTTDVKGNSVEVFDENQVEIASLEDLENQKQTLQKQIDQLQEHIAQIDAKLTAIAKL